MTRRVVAPSLSEGTHRRGGTNEKAQAGLAANELFPVWAVVLLLQHPRLLDVGHSFRKRWIGGSYPPRGIYKCLTNTLF
jgi:hypothetical protein